MATRTLIYETLGNVDVNDCFFDSLRDSYSEFNDWFASKASEKAYLLKDDHSGSIEGLLYLKTETGPIEDVQPNLGLGNWLKIGTLKINAAGTKTGERVLKKAFDHAVSNGCVGIYVTVFAKHKELVALLSRYGFELRGSKETQNGTECVYVKDLQSNRSDIRLNYPRFSVSGRKHWLLAIYPEYHTRLLPDSKLITDAIDVVKDVSHTNTIEKIYVGKVALARVQPGDLVFMYRTCDRKGPAYYRSVATSVCVAIESKRKRDFIDEADFVQYCQKHSVFSQEELSSVFRASNRTSTLRLLYNAAFGKRIIRKHLLEDLHVSEQPRWDLRELSEAQSRHLLDLADVPNMLLLD